MTVITIFANPNPFFDDLAVELERQGASVTFVKTSRGEPCPDLLATIEPTDKDVIVSDHDRFNDLWARRGNSDKRILRGYDYLSLTPRNAHESFQFISDRIKKIVENGQFPILFMDHLFDHLSDDVRNRSENSLEGYTGLCRELTHHLENIGLLKSEHFLLVDEFIDVVRQVSTKEVLSWPKNIVLVADHHAATKLAKWKLEDILNPLENSKTDGDRRLTLCLPCPCCVGVEKQSIIENGSSIAGSVSGARRYFSLYAPPAGHNERSELISLAAKAIIADVVRLSSANKLLRNDGPSQS